MKKLISVVICVLVLVSVDSEDFADFVRELGFIGMPFSVRFWSRALRVVVSRLCLNCDL